MDSCKLNRRRTALVRGEKLLTKSAKLSLLRERPKLGAYSIRPVTVQRSLVGEIADPNSRAAARRPPVLTGRTAVTANSTRWRKRIGNNLFHFPSAVSPAQQTR